MDKKEALEELFRRLAILKYYGVTKPHSDWVDKDEDRVAGTFPHVCDECGRQLAVPNPFPHVNLENLERMIGEVTDIARRLVEIDKLDIDVNALCRVPDAGRPSPLFVAPQNPGPPLKMVSRKSATETVNPSMPEASSRPNPNNPGSVPPEAFRPVWPPMAGYPGDKLRLPTRLTIKEFDINKDKTIIVEADDGGTIKFDNNDALDGWGPKMAEHVVGLYNVCEGLTLSQVQEAIVTFKAKKMSPNP